MKKTKKEIREEKQYKEFWTSIKNYNPPFYRLLAISDKKEARLLAICAAALIKLALQPKESRKKRKPSEWQVFLGSEMKEGRSIKDAASRWKLAKLGKLVAPTNS